MLNKIVLDLETQKSFEDVGGFGKNHLLKVSVCGVYSYKDDKYFCFAENEMRELEDMLSQADEIIGFNIINFDFVVLQPYLNFKLSAAPSLDILTEVEKIIGHRVKLDNLAQTTLGVGKSGDGLMALKLWKEGKIKELKKYCLDDVRLTKEIYDYALKNSKLKYKDYFDTKEISIKFAEPAVKKPVVRQGSLF